MEFLGASSSTDCKKSGAKKQFENSFQIEDELAQGEKKLKSNLIRKRDREKRSSKERFPK